MKKRKDEPDDVQVQTRVTRTTYMALRKDAMDDQRSVANLLRIIIQEHVEAMERR